MSIKFVDLFSGLGGFHAVGSVLDWECVSAVDFDKKVSKIYEKNWGINSFGDITELANDSKVKIPEHDVLFGGFPCQPFSKSGYQKGMDEARGTLFWNIAKIIEKRKPTIVLLENVRNIAGPRHIHEWEVIIDTLRELGYKVSSEPTVVSPHKINPKYGGRPQVRDRVFIAATHVGKRNTQDLVVDKLDLAAVMDWNIKNWDLEKDLPLDSHDLISSDNSLRISPDEEMWLHTWEDFLQRFKKKDVNTVLPGFPLWAEIWLKQGRVPIKRDYPKWKKDFILKNKDFYSNNAKLIDSWLSANPNFANFPTSRQKLEWQAQDMKSIWHGVAHFRPSGIRVKKANYVPALVAITQTSVLCGQRRKLSVDEAKRLQGLPEWYSFTGQSDKDSFKQLGNGVSVGAVYQVLRALTKRDEKELKQTNPNLWESFLAAPISPDQKLEKLRTVKVKNSEKLIAS